MVIDDTPIILCPKCGRRMVTFQESGLSDNRTYYTCPEGHIVYSREQACA